MAKKVYDRIFLEDVNIKYRNFRGIETDRNAAGKRNFQIYLPEELALELKEIGWPVVDRLDQDGIPVYKMKANIWFHRDENGHLLSPKIWQVTDETGKRVLLNEQTVGRLDRAEIVRVDVELSPWNWHKAGSEGVSAIVERMVVKIAEDRFTQMYPDFDDGEEPPFIEGEIGE